MIIAKEHTGFQEACYVTFTKSQKITPSV